MFHQNIASINSNVRVRVFQGFFDDGFGFGILAADGPQRSDLKGRDMTAQGWLGSTRSGWRVAWGTHEHGFNPSGIGSFSPGLAVQRTTLGNRPKSFPTPTGLHRRRARRDATLSGLFCFALQTQGSSCLATLG